MNIDIFFPVVLVELFVPRSVVIIYLLQPQEEAAGQEDQFLI